MHWIRRLLISAVLIALAIVGLLASTPDPKPDGPTGRALAARGPHAIRRVELWLEDPSRQTPATGDRPTQPTRTLPVSLWLPDGAADASYPLVVYSHGFMGKPDENQQLAQHLASRGFVVAAPVFPLTNRDTPDGADLADVPEQPRDVSFVIDALLARAGEFQVDPQRIGVVGLSLGGMTATLVTFHPHLRDARVRAAVVIAGPTSMFTDALFRNTSVPFLMIAGDIDAIVEYSGNARGLPQRSAGVALVTLAGGSHVGFTDLPVFLGWLDNPDRIACWTLRGRTPQNSEFMKPLGGEAEGIAQGGTLPCMHPLSRAMRPARQELLARMVVTAFLEDHLSGRGDARAQLAALAAESPELSVEF